MLWQRSQHLLIWVIAGFDARKDYWLETSQSHVQTRLFSWSPVDHCFINFNTRTQQSHLSIWRPRIFLLHWINATWLASRTMELMRCSIKDSQSSHDAYQLASGYGRLVQRWMLMKELSIPEKLKESSQWQRRKFSAYFQWGCYSSFYWLQRAVAVTVFLYFLIGIS